jgi:hypothetical protein
MTKKNIVTGLLCIVISFSAGFFIKDAGFFIKDCDKKIENSYYETFLESRTPLHPFVVPIRYSHRIIEKAMSIYTSRSKPIENLYQKLATAAAKINNLKYSDIKEGTRGYGKDIIISDDVLITYNKLNKENFKEEMKRLHSILLNLSTKGNYERNVRRFENAFIVVDFMNKTLEVRGKTFTTFTDDNEKSSTNASVLIKLK